MLRLWDRKGKAIKNWRSRAWSIDPKVTNLTIVRTEAKIVSIDSADFELNFNFYFLKLLKNYPEYFHAIADIEQLVW